MVMVMIMLTFMIAVTIIPVVQEVVITVLMEVLLMMLLLQISAFQDAFGLSIEVGPSAGADDSLAAESTVPKFRKPLVGKPELKLCTVTVANRFCPARRDPVLANLAGLVYQLLNQQECRVCSSRWEGGLADSVWASVRHGMLP